MQIEKTKPLKYLNYTSRFKTAIDQTKDLGLEVDTTITSGKKATRNDMIKACLTAFPSTEHMAYNCPHIAVVNDVLKHNGFIPGQITIGYLSYDNELEYECSVDALKKEINSDNENAIPMHAWITFPDGTILDPTLMASFEKDAGRLKGIKVEQIPLISQWDFPDFPIEIEYFPLLVGKDYLLKSNAIIELTSDSYKIGMLIADDFYQKHLKCHEIGSFNDMRTFYKKNDPEKYRDIVTGFRHKINHYISNGLVHEKKVKDAILYFSIDHPDLKAV